MEIPVLAKMMELDNLYHIYLFYFKKDDCSHRIWLFCVLLEYHVS